MDGRSLELRFAALRRRVMLIGGVVAAGWMLLVLVVLALVAAWFDLLWELGPEVRIGCDVLLAIAALVALGLGLYRLVVRSSWRSLARRLDQSGGTGGEILSGYELSRVTWTDAKSQPLTRGLAGIAVNQAARLAAGIPAHRVVPLATLRRMAIWLAVAAIGTIALIIFCPGLAETEALRFGDPFGDHPPYSNIVFHVEPGNTHVLYGGGLDVAVSTEGPPPQRVELVLRDGAGQEEVLPMFQAGPGQWRTVLARVTSDAQYFARARRARSARYAIEVITIPKLKNVRFRVAPPQYSRKAVYEGAMPEGGIAGLAGTQVQVFAESNRPLAHGSLVLASSGAEQKIKLEPVKGNPELVSGTFEISTPARFDVGVTDVAEHDSREKFSGSVVVLPDEAPLIRILQPPAMAYATPNAVLPVVTSGEDDCGISTMALYRSLNESRALPVDLDVPKPSPTRFDGQQGLPLLAYGLDPGDVIKVFARIEDNDPAGFKGAETPIVTVQIISQEDFERMQQMREGLEALVSRYRQADRRLESLNSESEELEKLLENAGDELSQEQREALEKLIQALHENAEQLRDAAEHPLPLDLDKKLSERLAQMAEALEEAAKEMEAGDLSHMPGQEAIKRINSLQKKLDGQKEKFDSETMAPLEHLEKVFPMIEDQYRFVDLYMHQRDLAERLASLKGMDENNSSQVKARMRNLEDEQNKLREELADLLDDIENHTARLPDDPELEDLRDTAQQFAQELRSSSADEAMGEAESGLAKFSGTDGHAGAKRAADILEQFLAKCKQCEGKGRGQCTIKFAPKLEQEMSNTIDQLLGSMGLGGQSGFGAGQSGYSMRRGGMKNVGLYGTTSGMQQSAGPGKQGDKQARGIGQKMAGDSSSNPALISDENRGAASGAGAENIPPRYRSRVGAYFKRIAEETPAE